MVTESVVGFVDEVVVDAVWQNRWEALDKYIEGLITRFEDRGRFSRQETIITVLTCLKAFGGSQVDYFQKGLAETPPREAENFPAENALAATIDQISYDISLLERAADQRFLYAEALELADHLAYEALKPMLPENDSRKDGKELVLRESTTVLTYFQKDTTVRIIPYAPIVLVGIPFTAVSATQDLLAIPHEIGHHVYRHSLMKREDFDRFWEESKFNTLPPRLKDWFEEIFADVYGALVAGPVIALSFQDLQMIKTVKDFYHDDGEHPVAPLRPLIYTTVLQVLEKNEHYRHDWSARLNKEWSKKLAKREAKRQEVAKVEALPKTVDFVDEKLETLVFSIIQFLLDEEMVNTWDMVLNGDSNRIQTLYADFDQFVQNTKAKLTAVPNITTDESNNILVAGQSVGRTVGNSGLEIDTYKTNYLDNDDEPTDEEWMRVLMAGGWTVKGPKCESTAGVCAG